MFTLNSFTINFNIEPRSSNYYVLYPGLTIEQQLCGEIREEAINLFSSNTYNLCQLYP